MSTCCHVKANGTLCESPALRREKFCYFHLSSRERLRRQAAAASAKLPIQLPVLEDQETIQLAIGDVVNALLADRIDPRKASLALYALQTASSNAKSSRFRIDEDDIYFTKFSPEPEDFPDPPLPEPDSDSESDSDPAPDSESTDESTDEA